MRGKDAVKRHSARGFGITPAYAGKSRGCPAACILRRDHPRVCGEKALLCLSLQQILGSPPRMRGKAFPSIKTILLMRITPAYAGKRRSWRFAGIVLWDHPRVCGEKVSQRPFRAVSAGSPPRMRGKGVHGVLQELCCGITPAYAGKSLFSGLYIRINGDHPRVCGEKLLDRYWIGTGLSDTKDHPRVCGEKTVLDLSRLVEQGSPPRMRGKA